MESIKIREKFLEFFNDRGHVIMPSSSLIPKDDPTLLFTNAGMNQFKMYFLGVSSPPHSSIATCQKCLRISGKHNDLENIGFTRRHHTFFEMLGNFSFGNYFKKEAVELAWSLVTKEFNLDPDRLFVTYFEKDKETAAIWSQVSGLPTSKIVPMSEEDNFWSMGDYGPCGPCTEILYYTGSSKHLSESDVFWKHQSNFLEIWNLVFMEFNKTEIDMEPLKIKCVDTGMGLERIASILQGVDSNFDTDLLKPIINILETKSGKIYHGSGFSNTTTDNSNLTEDNLNDISFRVVADHARAISFLIADGLLPGHEERNYVLRKLIRRACLFGSRLSEDLLLVDACKQVCRLFEAVYPELWTHQKLVEDVVKSEVEKFKDALHEGLRYLNKSVSANKFITGETAFTLHDTFGFPIELTRDIAKERGLILDETGFDNLMKQQKERSRGDKPFFLAIYSSSDKTEFIGYESLECSGTVLSCQQVKPDTFAMVFDKTPFYAESGGQVGDVGLIFYGSRSYEVVDTQKNDKGVIFHYVKSKDDLRDLVGKTVQIQVDSEKRKATCRAHSATHVLHYCLREVLGPDVRQAGSKVSADQLRFDFTFRDEINQSMVEKILARYYEIAFKNYAVEVFSMTYDEAIGFGAIALFGERYDKDRVRVVKIGPSIELCGGTHVVSSAELAPISIGKTHSVSSGVRRIEAFTGYLALDRFNSFELSVRKFEETFKTKGDFRDQLCRIKKSLDDQAHQLDFMQSKLASLVVEHSTSSVETDTVIFYWLEKDMKFLSEKVYDLLKQKYDKICLVAVDDTDGVYVIGGAKIEGLGFDKKFSEFLSRLGGKGGGSAFFGKGIIPRANQVHIENAIRKVF
ncbi:MAG: alanine--tRNA ligase [Deltaproteobacteria bacterium]|nr:alanine--tRNA ligase [Deltaproteobacteria bacterium]